MEKFATENLILIEILVDHVNFEYNVKKNLDGVPGEICVSFQFLDNAPILVCEEDFDPSTKKSCGGGGIKNGKSCLFSMTPEQAEQAQSSFDVYVQVFKKSPQTDKVLIGECLISILNLFRELMESATGGETIAKTLKDCFKLNSTRGAMVGNVAIYIRMSCYGKLIVTQFQMNLDDKSVEFKAKEGHYLLKFNKKEAKVDPCPCTDMSPTEPEVNYQDAFEPPSAPCYPQAVPQQPQPPTWYPPAIMQSPPTTTYQSPPQQTFQTPPQPTFQPPPPMFQPPMYQPPPQPTYQPPPTPTYYAQPPQCGCNAQFTQGMNSCGYSEVHARMGDSGALSARLQESQRYALSRGQNVAPFTFQLGNPNGAGNNVCITSPVCTAPDGTEFTEISDPNREMFVLRVGKKSEGLSPSQNVDLELCTPRPTRVPPELDSKTVQYHPGDLPADYLEQYYGKDEWKQLQKATGFKGGEKGKGGSKGGGKGKKKK